MLTAGHGSGGADFVSIYRVGVGLTSELIISPPTVGPDPGSSGLCWRAHMVVGGITGSHVLSGQPLDTAYAAVPFSAGVL